MDLPSQEARTRPASKSHLHDHRNLLFTALQSVPTSISEMRVPIGKSARYEEEESQHQRRWPKGHSHKEQTLVLSNSAHHATMYHSCFLCFRRIAIKHADCYSSFSPALHYFMSRISLIFRYYCIYYDHSHSTTLHLHITTVWLSCHFYTSSRMWPSVALPEIWNCILHQSYLWDVLVNGIFQCTQLGDM